MPVYLYRDDFNDGLLNSDGWTYERRRGGPADVSVTERYGYLDIQTDQTDNGGEAMFTPAVPLQDFSISLTQLFHATTSDFLADTRLIFLSASGEELQANVRMLNTNFDQDYAPQVITYDPDGVEVRTEYGPDLTTSYLDRWIDTRISFQSSTGLFQVDVDGDSINEFSFSDERFIGATLTAMDLNSYGWFTGHYRYVDEIEIAGTSRSAPPWSFNYTNPADMLTFAHLATDNYNGDIPGTSRGTTIRPPEGWTAILTTWDGYGPVPVDDTGNSIATITVAAAGMQATAYREDATGRVVIAYRGTDGESPSELAKTSIPLGLGINEAGLTGSYVETTSYLQSAVDFYGAVVNGRPPLIPAVSPGLISFTGHSLGGMLAGFMAGQTGAQGMIFDSGPHSEIVQYLASLINWHDLDHLGAAPDYDRLVHTRVDDEILGAAVNFATEATWAALYAFLASGQAMPAVFARGLLLRWGDADFAGNNLAALVSGLPINLGNLFSYNITQHSMPLLQMTLYAQRELRLENYQEAEGFLESFFNDLIAARAGQAARIDGSGYRDAGQMFADMVLAIQDGRENVLEPLLRDADQLLTRFGEMVFGPVGNIVAGPGLDFNEVRDALARHLVEVAARALLDSGTTYAQATGLPSTGPVAPWVSMNTGNAVGGSEHLTQGVLDILALIERFVNLRDVDLPDPSNVTVRSTDQTGQRSITGTNGNDLMIGAQLADGAGVQMDGGLGDDILVGSIGADTLIGANGFNLLLGGMGDDGYVASAAAGARTLIIDRDGNDALILDGLIGESGRNSYRYVRDTLSFGVGNEGATVDIVGYYSTIGGIGLGRIETITDGNGQTWRPVTMIEQIGGHVVHAVNEAAADIRSLVTTADDAIDEIVLGPIENLRDKVVDILGGGIEDFLRFGGATLSLSNISLRTGSLIVDVDYDLDGVVDVSIRFVGNYEGYGVEITQDGEDSIVRLTASSSVLYDIFGSSSADYLAGTSQEDRIGGLEGHDSLHGLGGGDTLHGGLGDDRIDGGLGSDVMFGGAGDDVYIVNDANDLVIEFGNDGVDVVRASTSYSLSNDVEDLTLIGVSSIGATGNLLDNVLTGNVGNNVLAGGVGNDSLRGNAGKDTLYGGDDNDSLDGGAGNDTLLGGLGDDTLVGGLGVDVASYATATTDQVISLVANGQLTVAGFGTDSLFGIEGLEGGSGNDILTGDSGANLLIGDAGNDTLVGGAGNDTLNGGDGVDTAIYADATAGVSVNLGLATAQVTGGAGTEVLSGIENLIGSDVNDVLTGSNVANRIEGGEGNDRITGGAGADTLLGGEGNDLFVVSAFVDHATGESIVGDAGTDELRFTGSTAGTLVLGVGVNVERVVIGTGTAAAAVLTGTTAVNLDASALAQGVVLIGNAGANQLTGSAFNDSLDGGAGNDILVGGLGDDTLIGGAGVDMVSYSGATGDLSISLTDGLFAVPGFGSDSLSGFEGVEGGSGNDSLMGDNAGNLLVGGAGNDTLTGGLGNDTLNGGAGNDSLLGGDGNDLFLVDAFADHRAGEAVEGEGGIDELRYTGTVAGTLVLTSGVSVERVVIGTGAAAVAVSTGTAAIDIDGTALTGAVTMVGNAGANRLNGGAGNDSLSGGAGNDILSGGAGNDTLAGGTGIDVASYASATADLTVTLLATGSLTVAGFGTDSLSAIEGLEGGSGNDSLAGDAAANLLIGGAGDDTLTGNSGNDTLAGGAGDDSLAGGLGVDVATYASATTDLEISLVANGTLEVDGFGVDSLTSIEGLEGGSGNDGLTGDAGANLLLGGVGNDTLTGAAGNDTLNGGAGSDTASYAGSGAVTVDLALTTAQVTGGAGSEVLIGIENLIGSSLNDVMTGSKDTNRIDGGIGNDRITGAAGADALFGDEGDDLFIVGTFADHAMGEVIVGGSGLDELRYIGTTAGTLVLGAGVSVERVVIGTGTAAVAVVTGTTAINIDGSALTGDVTMVGNNGANRLTGGVGNDSLDGGAGNDILVGGAGNDSLVGGLGIDVASYASATAGLVLALGSGSLAASGFGTDTLISIEGLEGGSGNDSLGGDASANMLLGGVGDDTLYGGAGNDTLNGGLGVDVASYAGAVTGVTVNLALATAQVTGGAGSDVLIGIENLIGSSLNDVLTGNTGANRIDGGIGNDRITGAGGADALFGEEGDDLFIVGTFADHATGEVIVGGSGLDELRYIGTTAGTLVLGAGVLVERVVIGTGTAATAVATGTAAINIDGSALTDDVTVFGNAGANRITGGAGDDSLDGGNGNDILLGDSGNDSLAGGAGNDVLTGGLGSDEFIFKSVASGIDVIADFNDLDGLGDEGDVLRFEGIGIGGFAYLGDGAFSGGSDNTEARISGNQVLIDINGDGTADIRITLTGLASAGQLSVDDFLFV